jgi:hypothetical protein
MFKSGILCAFVVNYSRCGGRETSPKVGLRRPVLFTYRRKCSVAFGLDSKNGNDVASRDSAHARICRSRSYCGQTNRK